MADWKAAQRRDASQPPSPELGTLLVDVHHGAPGGSAPLDAQAHAESESLLRKGDEEDGGRTASCSPPPSPPPSKGDDGGEREIDLRTWADALNARAGPCVPSGSCSALLHHVVFILEFSQHVLSVEAGMLGTICWVFIVFSARIFVTPLWTWTFIPVLSPLYGHGPSWAETTVRKTAILCHVTFGMGMLVCATMQFDQQVRKSSPRRHRISGYLYVIFGVGCVAALQPLRSATAKDHGYGLTSFVEVASIMWLSSTALALRYARARDFVSHRRWMARSMACAVSPIGQRIMNFVVLVPLALGMRLSVAGAHGISFLSARWDARTGTSWMQIFASPPSSPAHAAHAAQGATLTGVHDLGMDANFPRVLSRNGYGVAEQLVFPASSWLGLLLVLVIAEVQPGKSISAFSSLDLGRYVGGKQQWAEQLAECWQKVVELVPSYDSMRILLCASQSKSYTEPKP